MFTFAKPLNKIAEQDLIRLIQDRVAENRQLEYKRQLPGNADRDKKEFVRDVVSFANSAGGHIIFGVAQSGGIATELKPIPEGEIDSAKLRFENIIRTSIEPTIHGLKIEAIKLRDGYALILEIPRSLFGLHAIKNRGAFVTRTSAGKVELDINEIRAAFVGSEAASDRLREFRADRTMKILNGDALWPLAKEPLLAIHLVPLAAFAAAYKCVIDKIPGRIRESLLFPPGHRPSQWTPKFSFEGFANILASEEEAAPVYAYAHLFRNGAIETVTALRRPVYLSWIELMAMDCAERLLESVDILEIPGPYYLLLALLNVGGLEVIAQVSDRIRTIKRESVILPELFLETAPASTETEMRSLFDMIWNAAGWRRSFSYDENGQYLEKWRGIFA